MPKIKTHKGTAKRIKKSGAGKLLRRKSYSNHFLEKKQNSRKRDNSQDHKVHKSNEKKIKKLLGM